MIEKTEYGVLISYDQWEEIQEQLCTTSQDPELSKLQDENSRLKDVLRHMTTFLAAGDNQCK